MDIEMVAVSSKTGHRRWFLVDTVRIRLKDSKLVNLVYVREKWDKCAGKLIYSAKLLVQRTIVAFQNYLKWRLK
jgi:hypothetical protein